MNPILSPESIQEILESLRPAQRAFAAAYPGASVERQPVHTFYGGAHLFTADVAPKLGKTALRALREHAPDFATFARAVALPGCEGLPRDAKALARLRKAVEADPESARRKYRAAWLAHTVYARVAEKLEREPVEDYRIDFEDGYGNRPDAEEDGHAVAAGEQMAKGLARGTLPPFAGIRVKALTRELAWRCARTLDLFVTTLLSCSGGRLPAGFVVTLPKVTAPEQVAALVDLLEMLERGAGLAPGSLKLEVMVETPQSIVDANGRVALPALVAAARGRCRGAHFGVYDFTAACEVTAAHQAPAHSVCKFARRVMQASLAGTGVTLSDGSTNVMPVGPHRAARGKKLTAAQARENRQAVHHAWQVHFADVRRALRDAYYQGWDLHPGQLPSRYAAVFSFFLEGLDEASARLRSFVAAAAQATRVVSVFDDAATGQGLLNYFLRGVNCGALTEREALATGLTLEELRTRSFVTILEGRRRGRS